MEGGKDGDKAKTDTERADYGGKHTATKGLGGTERQVNHYCRVCVTGALYKNGFLKVLPLLVDF